MRTVSIRSCDRNGFVLGAKVTAASVHDSLVFEELLDDDAIRPVMPYTRPHTKEGFFRKYQYAYDEYYDCYICPNNEILSYETTTREGYRVYRSNPDVCRNCPFLKQCTESRDATKRITRHIWEHCLEEADIILGIRKRTGKFTHSGRKRLSGYLRT